MAELPPGLSRRRFLGGAGLTAAAVALGACGGGDDDAKDDGTTTSSAPDATKRVLVPFLEGPIFATGLVSRVPLGVGDSQGLVRIEDTPPSLDVQLLGPDGQPMGSPVTVAQHSKGLVRAYFPFEVTVQEPGYYAARVDLGGSEPAELAFQVVAANEVTVPKPGDALPALVTPTTADPMGITPLCTATPACALHDHTIASALETKGPVAVIVATPAFCKSAACGPVHQVLLKVLPSYPEITGVHIEVYQHPEVNRDDIAPTLDQLKLIFEPVLILVGSDGKVAHRLDAIYDEDELVAKLSTLT